MLPEIAISEFRTALDALADELLATAGVMRPPVDAIAIARQLGMEVAWDDVQQGRARIVMRNRGAANRQSRTSILLKPEPQIERKHWAVAHEIGEAWAWRIFESLSVDPREAPPETREDVANLLANRVLLPARRFATDAADCGWDLLRLKEIYTTASHEIIARRMLDFAPPVVITIFDHAAITFRRRNTFCPSSQVCAIERKCWREVHDAAEPRRTSDGPFAVQGWPVHRDDWKREILRLELPEAD